MSYSPLTPQQVAQAEVNAGKESYPHKALVGLDQFVNVLTGGNPDETISSRAQRLANKGNLYGRAMSWALSKIQPSHGYKAEAGDLERADKVQTIEQEALK